MARLIKTDGTETEVLPKNGTTFQLAELQELVGGHIEVVNLPDGRLMMIDEDGKLKGLARNDLGTFMGDLSGIAFVDTIVGPVVVCEASEFD